MIRLNYNNLDEKTQSKILSKSKADIRRKFGKDLKAYAKQNNLNYKALLEEEALRNLYNYKYVFKL